MTHDRLQPAEDTEKPELQGATCSQTSRVSQFAAAVILASIFLTPVVGFWWLRSMAREAIERNSLAHTRAMLVRFTARTQGQWPQTWEDLAPEFEPADANYNTHSLEAVKQIVGVDFRFDPVSHFTTRERETLDEPQVIWLNDRPDAEDAHEANRLLLVSLRRHFERER